MKINRLLIFLLLPLFILTGCERNADVVVKDDFRKYYRQNEVEGCFAMYDLKRNRYIFCNKAQAEQSFSPFSTFKICNTLIALETGVVTGGNSILRSDSAEGGESGPHTQTMKSAFHGSSVSYYQELSRQVGDEKMKYWLEKSEYGNMDMNGGVDRFWLNGALRISPVQQVDFLKKLYTNKLPFSGRNMEEVRKIMLISDSANYVLSGKTGLGEQDNTDIGWFVGYLETHGDVYIFANLVQSRDPANPYLEDARKQIVFKIMKDLNIIS